MTTTPRARDQIAGMKIVSSAAALATTRGPCIRYGLHVAYWRLDEGLAGSVLWGAPGVADVELLSQCWSIKLDHALPAHCSVFDVARAHDASPAAVAAIATFVERHRGNLAQRIARQALIVPRALPGLVTAGFAQLYASHLGYPVQPFDALGPALAWLGRDEPDLAARLDAVVDEVARVDPELAALRLWLQDPAVLGAATLSSAARALGTSERTLQRRLGVAGTSFKSELNTARVIVARSRLVHDDSKVAAVAQDVGFSSEQHFSQVFRRQVGMAPAAFRRRTRRA